MHRSSLRLRVSQFFSKEKSVTPLPAGHGELAIMNKKLADCFCSQNRFCYILVLSHEGQNIGAVAQLGERCVRNAEVEGSTPFRSTLKAFL